MTDISNAIQKNTDPNTNSPKLSVIVPIYNVEQYLDECISSIINQTYSNLEIILVDDGSTGSEPSICDKYAKKDCRLTVIHKKNEGLVAARKTGLNAAEAPYVTFVDGDDYLAPSYYQKMMDWIINESPDVVIAGFTRDIDHNYVAEKQALDTGIYKDEQIRYLWQNMNCKDEEYYINGIFACVWSKIFKTELLRSSSVNIPEIIKMGEDAAFTFPYLLKCNKVVIDNSIQEYHYRIINSSMSRTKDPTLFTGSSALYEYLIPIYKSTNDPIIIKQLDLYHAFLIDVALSLWMDTKIRYIHSTNKLVKRYASETSLLNNPSPLFELDIPDELTKKIMLIQESKWGVFEVYWLLYKIKAIIKSHLMS